MADDDLDVLVVNFDALQTVNLLHLVEEVFLEFLRSANVENFVRHNGAFGELLAFLHEITLEHDDMFIERNEVLLLSSSFHILDDKAALGADGAADFDNTIDLGDVCGVLRTAGFEKLGHARETTGDILCLADLSGCSGDALSGGDFRAFLDLDVRTGGNRIAGEHILRLVHNDDLRVQVFLVLDDDIAANAGGFVNFLTDGNARDHVAELDATGLLGDNGNIVGIPLNEGLTFLHMAAIGDRNDRTDDDVVAF